MGFDPDWVPRRFEVPAALFDRACEIAHASGVPVSALALEALREFAAQVLRDPFPATDLAIVKLRRHILGTPYNGTPRLLVKLPRAHVAHLERLREATIHARDADLWRRALEWWCARRGVTGASTAQ